MSDEMLGLLITCGIFYGAGVGFSLIWGHITYDTTRRCPMLPEYDWELRWGARAMIFCWAWPALVLAMHGPKARGLGRYIGRVFRDGMTR